MDKKATYLGIMWRTIAQASRIDVPTGCVIVCPEAVMQNLGKALLEKFPFLTRYVDEHYRLYLLPISMDEVSGLRPDNGAYSRCPNVISIYLLGKDGQEIGIVGQRPYTVPAETLFGWTIIPERTFIERIGESVGPAIKRTQDPIHWVLAIYEKGVAGGYHATLFFPPKGETVNSWYAHEIGHRRKAEQQEHRRKAEQHRQNRAQELSNQRKSLQRIVSNHM